MNKARRSIFVQDKSGFSQTGNPTLSFSSRLLQTWSWDHLQHFWKGFQFLKKLKVAHDTCVLKCHLHREACWGASWWFEVSATSPCRCLVLNEGAAHFKGFPSGPEGRRPWPQAWGRLMLWDETKINNNGWKMNVLEWNYSNQDGPTHTSIYPSSIFTDVVLLILTHRSQSSALFSENLARACATLNTSNPSDSHFLVQCIILKGLLW